MTPFPYPAAGQWPPNYVDVLAWRQASLRELKSNDLKRLGALEFYRTHPKEFIEHWLITYDPRNAGNDAKLVKMPFVLFQRQREYIDWIYALIGAQNDGLCEKCRDMGATWLSCAVSVHLWRFLDGAAIGWGSRKENLVDQLGDPDSIFEKIRILIRSMPRIFWPVGFDDKVHMPFMRVMNPETGASITGESGDNIGRGGRKLIYFKDESAHYERPEKIEAALADNTRVQIDISSVNGLGNVFHNKREAGIDWSPGQSIERGKTSVFVMDVLDHPEKDLAWVEARRAKAEEQGLLHIFAQEIQRNYAASLTGVVIRAEWIKAAIDAHITLGFDDEGPSIAGVDVADDTPEGDLNAAAFRKGPILKSVEEWGGLDVGATARKAVGLSRFMLPCQMQYDSVGVGAGVKSETNRLESLGELPAGLSLHAWSAGAKVLFPEQRVIRYDKDSPLNKDFFANLKAQGWWELARRFERTWRAVVKGVEYDPGELISLSTAIPTALLRKLEKELSQVTYSTDTQSAKVVINKAPKGTKSPNMGDAVVMAYWPVGSMLDLYTAKSIG